jgi:hypothetical protein
LETAGNELETCYVATPEQRTHPIKKEVNNLLSMLLRHAHTHNFKELENKLGGPSKKRVNENVPEC